MQLNFNKKNIVAITKKLSLNIVSRAIVCVLVFSFCISYLPISPKFSIGIAHAATEINYQGKLMTSSNVAVPDGLYNMEFKLYTVSSGGSAIWTETRTGASQVQVTSGLFTVLLGSETSLSGIDFDQTIYLGVNIGGTGTPSWDGEMSPRKKFASVPSAFVSDTAKSLDATYATSTNLYASSTFTNALTINSYSGLLIGTNGLVSAIATSSLGLLTTNVAEGSNLYFTDERADARVNAVLSATTSLPNITTLAGLTTAGNLATVGTLTSGSIGSGFGNINIGSNTFTGNGSGLTALNASNISTGVLAIARGGTGTTTAPTFGQLLMGNTGGGYDLVATSTLGIGGSGTVNSGTAGQVAFYDTTGTAVSGTSTLFFANGNVGVGSTSPIADFSVQGKAFVGAGQKLLSVVGALSSGSGGGIDLITGSGGSVNIRTQPTSSAGSGDINLTTDNGDESGGAINVTAGSGLYAPGSIGLTAGDITGDPIERGGSITLNPGSGMSVGQDGYINIASTRGYVGIGTTGVSSARLTVKGLASATSILNIASSTGTTFFSFQSNGRFGIGTTTPSAKLAVTGTAGTEDLFNIASSTNASLFKIGATGATYFNNDAGTLGMVLLSNGTGSSPTWVATSSLGISGGGGGSGTVNSGLTGQVAFYAADGTAVSGTSTLFFANGNVGVGSTSPSARFSLVAGTDDTVLPAHFNTGVVTDTTSRPFLISQTWNNPSLVGSAFKVNVTNTNSHADSLLADFQVGGTSVAQIRRTGPSIFTAPGAFGVGYAAFSVDSSGNNGFGASSANGIELWAAGGKTASVLRAGSLPNQVQIGSASAFAWNGISTDSSNSTNDSDLLLMRDAAAVLQLGVDHATSTTNQTIKAHDVTTGTGASLTIAGGNGSVANGAIILQPSSGYVGIATTTPGYALTVGGDISLTGALRANGDAGTLGMVLLSNGTGSSPTWVATSSLGISGGGGGSGTVNSGLTGQVAFYAADGTAVSGTSTLFFANGNVGVGTTTPASAFAVTGTSTLDGVVQLSNIAQVRYGASNLVLASSTNYTAFFAGAGAQSSVTSSGMSYNIGIGNTALSSLSSGGVNNTALGVDALKVTSTGTKNVAVGNFSLDANTFGVENTAIGYNALTALSGTSLGNTALGANALSGVGATVHYNVAIGVNAGAGMTSGNANIIIGSGLNGNGITVPLVSGSGSNKMNIGGLLWGTEVNSTNSSGMSAGNIGIGSSTPSSRLTVVGASGSTVNLLNIASSTGASLFRIASTGATYFNNDAGTLGMVLLSNGTGSSPTWVATSSLGISGGGGGSGTVNSGLTGQVAFYAADGTAVSGTSTLFFANGNVGVGTTTPSSALTVGGNISVYGGITLPITSSAGLGVVTVGTSRFIHGYGGTQTNVFVGPSAGNLTNSGRDSIGIGSNALVGLTSARLAVAVGSGALERNSTGWSNTAVGESALNFVTTNGNNTGVGRRALYATTGANNTAIGTQAAESASSGSNNVYIGYLSGDNLTTGSSNIILGANIDFSSTTASNQLNIGNLIYSQGITGTGTTLSTGNMGIGTSTPGERLTVVGTIQSTDLLGGSTNLTVDANGNIIRDPSDGALKENIITLEDSLAKITQLRGVRYEWRDKTRFGTSTEIGVIAQEVEMVVPEVVSSGGIYKSVNIKNLVALLIEGVKELKAQVDVVKDKVVAISAWFGVDGDRLDVKGQICVDDVCVSKDQFKQILINSSTVTSLPASSASSGSTGSDSGSDTELESGTSSVGEQLSDSSTSNAGDPGESDDITSGDGVTTSDETSSSTNSGSTSSEEPTAIPVMPTPIAPPSNPEPVSTPSPVESPTTESAPSPAESAAPEPAPAPASTE